MTDRCFSRVSTSEPSRPMPSAPSADSTPTSHAPPSSRRSSSWSAARVADQRLRVLHRHAHQGRARGGRDRAAAVRADAWRETPFYTERERAALAWTEALTLIAETHAPDDVYEEVRKHFDEAELAALTVAVIAINAWNRVAIGTRMVPGTYQP